MSSKFSILLLTVHFMLVPQVVNATTPAIDAYGQLPEVSIMAISPGAEYVAFRHSTGKSDSIVIVSLENNAMINKMAVGKLKPRSLYFPNNKQLVIIVSKNLRISGFRGRSDISTAYLLDIKTSKIRQLLVPGKHIYKGQNGLGKVVGISPDKKYLYMPAFVGASDLDETPNYSLLRVSLDLAVPPRVIEIGDNHTIDYFVNLNGDVVAREVENNRTDVHRVLAKHGKKWVEIYKYKTDVRDINVVGITEDATSLVILDESNTHGRVSYYTI